MDLITELKQLHTKLPGYGLSPEAEKALCEYLQFLRQREDLLTLAQTYHDDIYENHRYTMAQVEGLQEQDGREEGLLFAVMYFARYELLDEVLARRGIPEDIKAGALRTCKELLQKSKNCYGSYGLRGMYRSGLVPYLMPYKFVLGRLCFEVAQFNSAYEVYRNPQDGTTVPVALPGVSYMPNGKRPPSSYQGELIEPYIRQEGTEITGFTFDASGCLCATPVTLKGYEKVLKTGDDVISVHIPKNGRMTPELVDEAFCMAEDFFARYYPEKKFVAYVCSSWLLNTDMREFLTPETNMMRFQKRFRVVMTTVNGYSLYWHIFGIEQFLPLDELQPANSFQSNVLERVKAGKVLYNGYGYILK